MGKHSGQQDDNEQYLQAKADDFDAAAAAIDAAAAENQTDYPSIRSYENRDK